MYLTKLTIFKYILMEFYNNFKIIEKDNVHKLLLLLQLQTF